MKQVVRQKQFGLAVDFIEQKRHGAVQGIALGDDQETIEIIVLMAGQPKFNHLVFVQPR